MRTRFSLPRLRTCVVLAALTLLAGMTFAAVVQGQPPGSDATGQGRTDNEGGSEGAPATAERTREGTLLKNGVGTFRMTGDRITFVPADSSVGIVALENLALERVARVLSESRQQRQWSVSGLVTEFRGSNYLLVTRAVLKARGS